MGVERVIACGRRRFWYRGYGGVLNYTVVGIGQAKRFQTSEFFATYTESVLMGTRVGYTPATRPQHWRSILASDM